MESRALSLGALCALILVGAGCAHAADDPPAQRIYLDPETGEVTDGPAEDESPANRSAQQTRKTETEPRETSRNRAWETEDGTRMLSVPNRGPAERVVRCPNGSLRMGDARPGADDDDNRAALCATSND